MVVEPFLNSLSIKNVRRRRGVKKRSYFKTRNLVRRKDGEVLEEFGRSVFEECPHLVLAVGLLPLRYLALEPGELGRRRPRFHQEVGTRQ